MEVPAEVRRVHQKPSIGLQECACKGHTVSRRHQGGLNLVDCAQPDPFFPLSLIRGNLGIELLRNAADSNAPGRLDDELFLEPQLLLKIFEAGKELDDLASDFSDHLDLRQV